MPRQAPSGKRLPLHSALPTPIDGQEVRTKPIAGQGVLAAQRYNGAAAAWEGVSLPAGLVLLGPFQVTSTAYGNGVQGTTNYAHGLGKVPLLVLFEVEDGGYSGYLGTRVTRDATNVSFISINNRDIGAAQWSAIYRFMILTS